MLILEVLGPYFVYILHFMKLKSPLINHRQLIVELSAREVQATFTIKSLKQAKAAIGWK